MTIDQSEPQLHVQQPTALDVPPPPDSSGSALPEPASERSRERFLPRTLTGRIVAGVTALVILVVTGIGAGMFFALRYFLDERLDQQLQTTAHGAPFLFNGNPDYGPRPTDVWATALDPSSGQVVAAPEGRNLIELQLSSAQRTALAKRQTQNPFTLVTADGTQLRAVVRNVIGRDESTGERVRVTVVVGLSTEDEHSTLHRLVLLELLIGGGAVLVAIVATTAGVRFSLRRLRGVTVTAQEVSAELSPEGAGLDRRVPFTEEGTEVGELATSFNTMLAAVETQFRARVASEERMRQFLADASHELRTPLTSIRGYAELARMQRAAGVSTENEADDDNLGRIESEGTRMSRLVDDLLTLARGEDSAQHPIEREPVDVPSLLDDVVNSSHAAFPQRPIDVEASPLPVVLGDRDQLLRAVRNLVTNAAVHTEQGRPVHVRGFVDGSEVVITVADGGPGLPPDQATQVFERFWRADKARTRARGGSGLGMSIVATIVRAHGGTVRFDSEVETGSIVTVRLPIAD